MCGKKFLGLATRAAVVILSLFALAFVACAPAASSGDGPSSMVTASPESTGSVRITIPAVSAAALSLRSSLGIQSSAVSASDSRAYMSANRCLVELMDADAHVLDTVDYSLDLVMSSEFSACLAGAAGSGNTVRVRLFNKYVSVDEPVVEGTSLPFDIVAGQNSIVNVYCLPLDAEPVAIDGASVNVSVVPSTLDMYIYGDQAFRGEKWLSFTANDAMVDAVITPVDKLKSGCTLYLYDGDGQPMYQSVFDPVMRGAQGLSALTSYEQAFHDLVPGKTYYIACQELDLYAGGILLASAGDFSVSLKSSPFSLSVTDGGTGSAPALMVDMRSHPSDAPSWEAFVPATGTTALVDFKPDNGYAATFNSVASADGTGTFAFGMAVSATLSVSGDDEVYACTIIPRKALDNLVVGTPLGATYSSGEIAVYAVPVTGGKTYSIVWDEAGGSGSYAGDISVSAWDSTGKKLCSDVDTAYSWPLPLAASGGVDMIYLKIRVLGAGTTNISMIENP